MIYLQLNTTTTTYNLEILTKKTKILTFQGNDPYQESTYK